MMRTCTCIRDSFQVQISKRPNKQNARMARALAVLMAARWCNAAQMMHGFDYITFNADTYSSQLSDASMQRMAATGITHVQLLVTWYLASLNSTTIAPNFASPTFDSLTHAVTVARSLNLTVIIKPHVDVLTGEWRGQIGTKYNSSEQWDNFFSNYTSYMLSVAAWADTLNGAVWGFNVGTEYVSATSRTADWRAVIAAVRSAFPGVMWYGANWGTEPWQVQFWDALDYIGVDAYYPVASNASPNMSDIAAHWAVVNSNLTALASKWGKSIVFAELGYRSYAGAGENPGKWTGHPAPDAAQQLLLWQGFFNYAYTQPWLVGVFPWDWFTTPYDGGVCDNGYSIQRKPAQALFAAQYGGQVRTDAVRVRGTAAPLVIYQNGVTTWRDQSWQAAINLTSSTEPYPGHAASIAANVQAIGALSLGLAATINIAAFSALTFDIRVDPGDNITAPYLSAWLCSCDDCTACSLRHLPVAQYLVNETTNCALPGTWGIAGRVEMPFEDLGVTDGMYANSTSLQRLAVQYTNATGATNIYVDNIILM